MQRVSCGTAEVTSHDEGATVDVRTHVHPPERIVSLGSSVLIREAVVRGPEYALRTRACRVVVSRFVGPTRRCWQKDDATRSS